MKRTILALVAGLLIGMATLGPLAATASENQTLRQRVRYLEARVDHICTALVGGSTYTVDQGYC